MIYPQNGADLLIQKCAIWANMNPATNGTRNDPVTFSQAWEQEAHLRLQVCTSFPECFLKPGLEAMLKKVLSFPWVFVVQRGGGSRALH